MLGGVSKTDKKKVKTKIERWEQSVNFVGYFFRNGDGKLPKRIIARSEIDGFLRMIALKICVVISYATMFSHFGT